MKRMIAIFLTATIMMFAVSPAFADDTGKKSPQIATTIADVNFEAVSPLDLAPPADVPITTDVSQYVSQEDYPADIVHAAVFTSKHNQESFNIYKKSTSQKAIVTAGTVANYTVINRAPKNTPIIQANTPQAPNASMQYVSRSNQEDCPCDIVITFEASSTDQLLTAPTDEAVTEVPNVVPRE